MSSLAIIINNGARTLVRLNMVRPTTIHLFFDIFRLKRAEARVPFPISEATATSKFVPSKETVRSARRRDVLQHSAAFWRMDCVAQFVKDFVNARLRGVSTAFEKVAAAGGRNFKAGS
jgi:hypothetical protein